MKGTSWSWDETLPLRVSVVTLPPLLSLPALFPPKKEVNFHFLLLPLLLVLEAEEAPLERRSSLGASPPRPVPVLEGDGRATEYFRGIGADDESSASGDVMPGVDILRPGRGGPEAPSMLPARLPKEACSYWLLGRRTANESRLWMILFSLVD